MNPQLKKTVFATGGCGYIGSHTVVELLNSGYEVIILDDFSNSKESVIDSIELITGHRPLLYIGSILDQQLLRKIFASHKIDAVIHFAGLKSVSESEAKPLLYYETNVSGSIQLLKEMVDANISKLVFSSSATVYGGNVSTRYDETMALIPINVYGYTKYMVEKIFLQHASANQNFSIINLRYFNPVGAHQSGLIGEDPNGIPNNLMPFISKVALGELSFLSIYGDDYPTPDGTCLRDYIHIADLASGHLAALKKIEQQPIQEAINLGTGKSYSVFEMIRCFEAVSGVTIPYKIVGRRKGDLSEYYADPTFAKKALNWQTQYGIEVMCADLWNRLLVMQRQS
jgi:UDP-glucose 4-epimerase